MANTAPLHGGRELIRQGTELFRAGQFEAAIELLNKVPNADPATFAQALALVGRCNTRLKKYEMAIEYIEYANSTRPSPLTKYYLGEALFHQGDSAAAIVALEMAVGGDDKLTDAFILIGTIKRQAGRFEEAIRAFNMALRNDPKAIAARFQLAQTSYDTGDLQRATSQAYMIVQQAPEFAPVHLLLGHCALRMNDFRQAASEYCRVLKMMEPTLEVYEGLGRAFANLKDFPQALKAFDAVLMMDPQHEMGYVAGARLAERMEEMEKAKLLWRGAAAFPKYAELATQALKKLGVGEPPAGKKMKAVFATKYTDISELPVDFEAPPELDRSRLIQRPNTPVPTAPLTTHAGSTLNLSNRQGAPTQPIRLAAPEAPSQVDGAFQQLIKPYAAAFSNLFAKKEKVEAPRTETIADMMRKRSSAPAKAAPETDEAE